MVIKLDAQIEDVLPEGAIYFPEYNDAMIGVSSDGNAVYSYEKMVDCLMRQDGMSDEEAMEWIDYNTIRSLPYFGQQAPIIVYTELIV